MATDDPSERRLGEPELTSAVPIADETVQEDTCVEASGRQREDGDGRGCANLHSDYSDSKIVQASGAQSTDRQAIAAERRAALVLSLVYALSFVAIGAVTSEIGPAVTTLAAATDTAVEAFGAVFTASGAGYLAGAVVAGRAHAHHASHGALACALALCALCSSAIALATSFTMVLVAVTLAFAGAGCIDASCNALLVWAHASSPPGRLNAWMQLLHFAFGAGALVSPALVSASLAADAGIVPAFVAVGVFAAPVCVVLLVVRAPVKPGSTDRRDEGESAGINGSVAPLSAAASADLEATPDGARERQQRLSASPLRLTVTLAAMLTMYVGNEVSCGGWVAGVATLTGLMSAADAALVPSVFWGSITFGRLLAAPLTARASASAMLACCVAGALAAEALFLLGGASLAALWAGTVVLGLSMSAVFPLVLTLPSEHGRFLGAGDTALCLVGASVGKMAVPALTGALMDDDLLGPRALFWVLPGATAVFALLFYVARVLGGAGREDDAKQRRGDE